MARADVHLPAWGWLAALVLAQAMACVFGLWEGFVLTKLWAWFIVPGFGAEPLSLKTAVGISLFLTLACPHGAEERSFKRILSRAVLASASAFVLGCIFFWLL